MNIFMKRILSISPWVAALLVIRAIKIKKINRELKTLEQLEEKTIDEIIIASKKKDGWEFYFWLELYFSQDYFCMVL